MTDPLRIGLVGCGRLAEVGYVPAAGLARGLAIAGVCDPDPGRRAVVGNALGLDARHRHGTIAALIDGTRPDAVVIASPVGTHVEGARAAAAAGIPSLVEKPPAPNAAATRELTALEPPPSIAFNRRFSLGRGLAVSGGGDGAPAPAGRRAVLIEAEISYRRRSWDPVGDLGDAWLDLGPHLVDLALLAGAGSGGPLEVASAELERDAARVELRAPGCRVALGCAIARPHRERLRIEAGSGRPLFERREGGLRGLVRVPGRPHPLVSSLAAQLEAFALLARGHEPAGPAPATADEGLRVMELVDAARDVDREGAGAAA